MERIVLVEKMPHHEEGRHEHRDVGGDGRSADSPVEAEEEKRRENHVHTRTYHIGVHRLARIAGGAHHVVVGERQVHQDASGKHPEHELAGVRQRFRRSSEYLQDRIDEDAEHHGVKHSDDERQLHAVAENHLRHTLVVLSQHDRDTRCRAGSDKHTEGSDKVHDRESDRDTAHHVRVVDGMADHYRVYDVVNRADNCSYHSRQAVLEQNLADWRCAEFAQAVGGIDCLCSHLT